MSISRVRGLEQTRHLSLWTIIFERRRRLLLPASFTTLLAVALALLLLLFPPLPWNIRLPFYLALLIWTALRPRIALYFMPLAVAWGSLDPVGIGSLRVNAADILVGFLAIGWLLSYTLPAYLQGPEDKARSTVPVYIVLALSGLLIAMLLSMTGALNKSDSLKEVSKWLEFLVLLVIGSQYLRTRRQVWLLVVMICLAALTQAFYGYAQAIFTLGPQSFIRDASLRVYGTFDQPNPFAGYINMTLSVTLALTLLGSNWYTRLLAGITSALLAAAVYLTQSRGGEIALIAVLAFILLVGLPGIRAAGRVLLIAILAIVEALIAGLIPAYLFDQLFRFLGLVQISFTSPTDQDYSTAERLAHWIAGLHMYFDHPWLGVGIGNYPDAYPHYYITIFTDSLGHAHNYYINIAAETGTIGLIAYVLFLLALFVAGGSVVRRLGRRYQEARAQLPARPPMRPAPMGMRNKLSLLLRPWQWTNYYRLPAPYEAFAALTNDRALAIGLLAALLSVCVHNLVDNLYVHSMTNLLALLCIALIRLEKGTPDVLV